MKPRLSTWSSIPLRITALAALTLAALLILTMVVMRGTPNPVQKDSLGLSAAPPPVETVSPTTGTQTTATQTTPTAVSTPEIVERDYGTWGYTAARFAPETIAVSIRYDLASVDQLSEFAAANQILARDLPSQGGQAEVYITFRNYLTPEQFRTWVRNKGLSIQRSELRTEKPSGHSGTLGQGKHEGDTEPLPQDRLDESLQRMGGQGSTIRGVYFTVASVDAASLPQVASDPLVFIANVTPNVVRNELHAAGWQTRENSLYVDPPTPFAKMEKLGLENFTR